jgi:hypothetical protein
MKRMVIRPRIQIPLLVVIFSMWGLLGVTLFTAGAVVAKRDWFGIVMGGILIISGVAGSGGACGSASSSTKTGVTRSRLRQARPGHPMERDRVDRVCPGR